MSSLSRFLYIFTKMFQHNKTYIYTHTHTHVHIYMWYIPPSKNTRKIPLLKTFHGRCLYSWKGFGGLVSLHVFGLSSHRPHCSLWLWHMSLLPVLRTFSLSHRDFARVIPCLECSFFLPCLTLISFWQSPWCILSKDLFTKASTSLSSLLHRILVKFACCSQHGFLLVLHGHRSPCHHRPWYQPFLIPGCSSSWWYHGWHHSDLHLNLITEAFPRHLA